MNHSTLSSLALLLFFGAVACDNNPAKGKVEAVVSAAQPVVSAAPTAKSLTVATSESTVKFVGAKITGKHDGSFGKFAGTVTTQGTDPTRLQVKFTVDMASMETDQPKLTKHLQGPDFFDIEKFPEAKFESTSIAPAGADGKNLVTGNLTLHGQTKSIQFPATIHLSADQVHTTAEFVIDRKAFGIVYPGMPDDLIKDEVALSLNILAR